MSQDYMVNWVLDTSRFMGPAQTLETQLRELDALTDKVGAGLKGMTSGAARRINGVSTAADRLTKDLKEVDAAADRAHASVNGIGRGATTATAGMTDLTAAFSGLITVAAGLGLVKQVVGEVGDAIKEAREKAEDKGEKSLGYRGQAQELAALMGKPFADDEVLAKVFSLGPKTGWKFDQSNAYLKEVYSGLPTAEKLGKIREDQFQEVAEAAAPGFRRLGIAPETGGRMLGVAVQGYDVNNQVDAQGRKMTPTEATQGLVAGMGHGLSVGGVGPISQLGQAEMKSAATSVASGRLADPLEASAWIGLFSGIKGPGGAATGYSQFENLLFRNTGKEGEFFDAAGISGMRTTRERAGALRTHLRQNGGQDWNSYLASQGFGQKRERDMVVAGLGRLEAFDKLNAEVHDVGKNPAAAATLNRRFLESRTGRAEAGDAAKEGAAWFGTGRHMESYLIGLREAEAEMEATNSLESEEKLTLDALSDPLKLHEWLGAKSPLRERVEHKMKDKAFERAKAHGIDVVKEGLAKQPETRPYYGGVYTSEEDRPLELTRPIEQVMERLDELGAVEAVRPIEGIESLSHPGAAARPAAAGAGNAAAGGGPQAKIDGSDVKEGGKEFREGVREFRSLLASLKGGRGGATPLYNPSGPYRPGSIG